MSAMVLNQKSKMQAGCPRDDMVSYRSDTVTFRSILFFRDSVQMALPFCRQIDIVIRQKKSTFVCRAIALCNAVIVPHDIEC